MATRKGQGKGMGQGYKNLNQRDSKVHEDSARGKKQPQKLSIFARLGASAKNTKGKVSKMIEERQLEAMNRQKETRLEEQRELETPEFKKLKSQEKRVNELRFQIKNAEDDTEKDQLKRVLIDEEFELNERIEDISDVKLEDYSDRELKSLAIRVKDDDGFLSGFFGSSENIYEKELLRRTTKRRTLNQKIKEEQTKPLEKEEGFFEGLF